SCKNVPFLNSEVLPRTQHRVSLRAIQALPYTPTYFPRRRAVNLGPLTRWLRRSRRPSLGTHPQFRNLSPLQEPASFEDRRHRLLDPRGPRPRLLRASEVKQISPLPTRRQRLECALEPWIVAEFLFQFLGHRNSGGLRLDLHSGLLGRHGF